MTSPETHYLKRFKGGKQQSCMQRRTYCKCYVQASAELQSRLKTFVYRTGTAKAFAKQEGIGYEVFLDYLNGVHPIPLKLIEKLAEANKESLWEILKGEFIRSLSTKNIFRVPKKLTSTEANLMGWILSEGHLAKYSVVLSQKNKEALLKLKSCFENCFHFKRIKITSDRHEWKLNISGSAFKQYLNLKYFIPCGKKSYFIQVPKQIYASDKEVISAFLCGCLEGDGCFNFSVRNNLRGRYTVPRICLDSASFSFLLGVKKLFEQLGLTCKIHSYELPSKNNVTN